MKHLFIVLLAFLSFSSFSQVKTINFDSGYLQQKRELYVSLPASYEKNPTKRYPLLVLMDGDYLLNPFLQTLNFGAHWDDLPELIIVGISQGKNNQRSVDCGWDEVT